MYCPWTPNFTGNSPILQTTSLNPHAAARYGSPLIGTAKMTRAFFLAAASVARL